MIAPMRWAAVAALILTSSALAQGARVAVHPLDARELTVEQREWLRAFFDVRLARTNGIRLAGSNRVDDALRLPRGKDCETRDTCLRHLAEHTDSLYGVYARLRREPVGGELLMTARVVRADGVVVNTVSRRAHPAQNVELLETCRALVSQVVDELDLRALPDTLPAVDEFSALPPPPLLTAEESLRTPPMSLRRKIGLGIAATGLATLATGSIVFGVATDGRGKLNLDDGGAVPSSQTRAAASVANQARVSSVLIPIGAVIAAAGAVIALLPDERRVSVSFTASPGGGGVLVAGALP